MLTGVLIFICGYTLADQWTQKARWRRDYAIRLSLKIGYITRMAVSVIFPVGGFLDVVCGMFSISAVEFISATDIRGGLGGMDEAARLGAGFLLVLLTTLVQGVVLNILLLGYTLVVWGIVVLVSRGR